MKKITIIDGQGGRMGKAIVEQLKKEFPKQELLAIGTNSIATAAMLKAGADYGATGENPVIVAARDSDIIIGPIGIVIADSLFGEVTPAMAVAVGQSKACQLLMPVNRCNHHVAGCENMSLNEIIAIVIQQVREHLQSPES
ncbi:MAG: DUF3842 family protein [Lachnospiraceae bacterium]|nr:DUF3842 family protein [Lachnospiraceae bacterium]